MLSLRPINAALLTQQTLQPETFDWVRRVKAIGGTVTTSTINAVNAFVIAAKLGGWLGVFRRLNLCCGDFIATLVPLIIRNGAVVDTPVGLTSSDYAESTGWVSNGACHIATGDVLPLGQSGLSAYVRTLPTVNGTGRSLIGARTASSNAVEEIGFNAGGTPSRVRSFLGSNVPQIVDGAQSVGLWHTTRPASGVMQLYRNGVDMAGGTATAPTVPTLFEQYVLATNQADTRYNPTQAGQAVSAYSIDNGMTPAQAADFYSAMQAFQVALQRQV